MQLCIIIYKITIKLPTKGNLISLNISVSKFKHNVRKNIERKDIFRKIKELEETRETFFRLLSVINVIQRSETAESCAVFLFHSINLVIDLLLQINCSSLIFLSISQIHRLFMLLCF